MEFRENLELTEEGGERQVCVSEEEALEQLEKYLSKLTHPMLVGLDMSSLGLVMDRLGSYCKDKLEGWTTWSTLLQQLAPQFHQMDLEDFYEDVCGCKVKQYSTAADIASYLAVAVKKL